MIDTVEWVGRPPQLYSIVTGYYPEAKPKDGIPDCRPLLVTQVLTDVDSGAIGLRVCYGTSKLRFPERAHTDLIIQNSSDLDECGLLQPTRFVVHPSQQEIMVWGTPDFEPWSQRSHPRLGTLPDHLQKEYAWLMAQYL